MTFSVLAYCDRWPVHFGAIRGELMQAFDGASIEIEHIGSTAVPGLCAKPVVDVLVGAASLAVIEAAIPRLDGAGFRYVSRHEAELPMRRYFVKAEGEAPRVHVHGVCTGSTIWHEHLRFRDALRTDPVLRGAYAQLKRELARIHSDDKSAYTAAKAPFIRQVLAGTGSSIAMNAAP
jgi:GrpB-like predicted nucleotidyltransferase (UPF0157 family)